MNCKPKKCRICKDQFTPRNSLQFACSPKCAITHAGKQSEKKQKKLESDKRKKLRADRERIKSRSDWLKEAQKEFNAYIRARDKGLPCISCQRFHTGQYHAGHYRTVGAHPELRFNEDNCHKQCSVCNNHLSGNLIDYRINLLKKIGSKRLEILEGYHEPKKLSIEDIKEIKANYKQKLKDLI